MALEISPDTRPDYKTVFILPAGEYPTAGEEWIPEWVMKYELTEEELKMIDESESEQEEK